MTAACDILTIGHSTHSWEHFSALLAAQGVTAIADVRSAPYSRHTPQFSREALAAGLRQAGMSYVFLGRELGGRPADATLFHRGVADYDRMAQQPEFGAGLARVMEGAARYRVALMCAEQDPLDCHRCLLVGRHLAGRGCRVGHILADGGMLTQAAVEATLLAGAGATTDDLFLSRPEQIAAAYRARGQKIAYAEEPA